MILKKLIGVLLIVILVLNIVLFAMGRLEVITFWSIILFTTVVSYIFYKDRKKKKSLTKKH